MTTSTKTESRDTTGEQVGIEKIAGGGTRIYTVKGKYRYINIKEDGVFMLALGLDSVRGNKTHLYVPLGYEVEVTDE